MTERIDPIVPEESGNTKQIPPAKLWCFTWNNPTVTGDELANSIQQHNSSNNYVFQYEMGESGTPHFQGFIAFKNKVRPKGLFGTDAIHWEKKGKKSTIGHNINYCTKEPRLAGPWLKGFKKPRERRELNFEWRDWQRRLQDIARSDPDDRSIYWYWSEAGSVGKSVMAEWLLLNFNSVICSGKAADMKYLIAEYEENKGFYPDVIIFDVPRSSSQYISYTGMEEIKNGIFCSQKYKCKMVVMPHPHVFVFANEEPDEDQISVDRLKVYEIK